MSTVVTATTELKVRNRLVKKLLRLQTQAAETRQEIAALGRTGGFRPQAKLIVCSCGAVLTARERREHKCATS